MTGALLREATHDPARAWQVRCSELTHDWLRNRFLPRVHALLAIARGDAGASTETIAELVVVVNEWPTRRAGALSLLDEYCDAMWPPDTSAPATDYAEPAAYVRRVTIESWTSRHRVADTLAEARNALTGAHAAYESWIEQWESPAGPQLARGAVALNAMAERCACLLAALSRLPSPGMV